MIFRLQTLKKRADFLRARNGRYFAAPGLVLQVSKKPLVQPETIAGSRADTPKSPARFGFTATKKLGNAVVRNRIKRRLRETVREIAPQLARDGYEYVLIGRKSTLKRPFSSLLQDLTLAFAKVHAKRVHGKRVVGNAGTSGNSGKNRKNSGRRNSVRPHKDRR